MIGGAGFDGTILRWDGPGDEPTAARYGRCKCGEIKVPGHDAVCSLKQFRLSEDEFSSSGDDDSPLAREVDEESGDDADGEDSDLDVVLESPARRRSGRNRNAPTSYSDTWQGGYQGNHLENALTDAKGANAAIPTVSRSYLNEATGERIAINEASLLTLTQLMLIE